MTYQVMPPLSEEEYEALKADIAERGVQVPVEYDEDGNILDGYHRVKVCEELGIEDFPRFIRTGLTEEQKTEHAILLNIARRQVSREWKQQKAAELRAQGWSYRRIGRVLGVAKSTLHDWLGIEVSETGQLDLPSTITGSDGKQYPAQRAEAPQPPESTAPTVTAQEDDTPAHDSFSSMSPAPPSESQDKMAVHYSSERLDWGTPQGFFDLLNSEFRFTMDVCATPKTAKCARYYTREDDGLSQRWRGICWMNPPYGNEIGEWMEKAYKESRRGAWVICLVPSRTDTRWWHEYAMKAREIRFIRGRLRFEGAEANAPFPSAVVVLAPGYDGPPVVAGVSANG